MNGGPSETVEVEALLATSVLDADNVPNKNQSTECFSCDAKMVGLYCKECGQKNDNFRRSIFGLGVEAFTSIFSLESRIWKTWLSLFIKPGRAAREFADGKRTLWTSPVRIYLAMSIILFGYMGLTDTRLVSIRTDLEPKTGVIGKVESLNDSQIRLSPEVLFFARQKEIDRRNANVNFERVERLLDGFPAAKFHLTKEEAFTTINTKGADNNVSENILFGISTVPTIEQDDIDDIEEAIDAARGAQDKDDLSDEEKTANHKTKHQRRSLNKLNNLLLNYPDSRALAQSLADQSLPLNETTFTENLPSNLEADKRSELIEKVSNILKELSEAEITTDVMPALHLDLYKKDALFLSNININGNQLNASQIRQVTMTSLRQPAILNEAFATYLPRIMFLMMPYAMFIGVIFIRGKKTALMYDHLVHAAYIHAFLYLFLLILIMLSQWANIHGLYKVFFWGVFIYLPISAKYMFKRGWFKTFLASYSIALNYAFVMLFIMIALLIGQLNKAAGLV